MNNIVEKNLELMTTRGDGSMVDLMIDESLGGNAHIWKDYPCGGANFRYDPETGEIKCFENLQNVPEEFKGFPAHILRIAVNLKGTDNIGFYIVNYYPEELPITARVNLEKTVKLYNKNHAFKP
ncbi:hypothetical protein HQ533_03320 [Candidatus Woesearchaeota archaeon]|nr:hypothetical protein [Candidatus Woesearchaeota archaeon]